MTGSASTDSVKPSKGEADVYIGQNDPSLKFPPVIIEDGDEISEANCFPKDRGWSWVVLLSAFLLHTIAVGVCLASGLFLVEFMEVFQTHKMETAWISSMQLGVAYLIAAPVSGAVSEKFSHRTSIIWGGLIMFIGIFLSSFANGIVFLYLSCGLVAAPMDVRTFSFGIGLVYSPSIGIIGFYFESRLPLALGIVMAGGGAGAMVFSVLFSFLIEQYQWRGALIITSAIVLHCCVFGAILFPKSFWKERQNPTAGIFQFSQKKEKLKTIPNTSEKSSREIRSSSFNDENSAIQQKLRHELHVSDKNSVSSLKNKPHQSITSQQLKSSSLICTAWQKIRNIEFPLLRNIRFILFFLNSLFMCFGTYSVFILVVDYAHSCGLERRQASMLLSLLGLTSAAGRFVMAAVMMLLCGGFHISALHPYVVVTMFSAVSVIFMPLCGETFGSFLVLCAMFGFSYGGICSSSPMVVSEFFGAHQLTTVYPYMLIASGIGCLLGPPFSGWMFEVNGSYRVPFLLNGFVVGLSVILLLPLSYMSCRKACNRRRLHSEIPTIESPLKLNEQTNAFNS